MLSIIVTSYSTKRINDIFSLIESLREQTYPDLEVIYVIERSKELYNRIQNYVTKRSIRTLKLIFSDQQLGLTGARNLGIRNSSGDILAFIDDDVVLFPDWAKNTVNTFDDSSIVASAGPAIPLWENTKMQWLPNELYWVISCTGWYNSKKISAIRNVWGHNMSFRKEVFDKCGLLLQNTGFALSSGGMGDIGEDLSFSMLIRVRMPKGRIVYNPNVKVWHRVYASRTSLQSIFKRAYWVGHTRYVLRKTYCVVQEDTLTLENKLLHTILTSLLPKTLKSSLRHPRVSCNQCSLTLLIVLFTGLGYLGILKRTFKI